MTVWTPHYRLRDAAGTDITPAVRARLIGLSYEEQAEDKSDRLTLTLDDRLIEGARTQLPGPDTPIALEIGYQEAASAYLMGWFRVDEVAHSGPPDTIEITASAAALSDEIRSKESRSWDQTTIGAIVETIAGEHDLEARVSDELASIPVEHADQQAESPIAFLTRLTRQHDAVARPLGNLLVVVPKGQAKTVSGRELPTFRFGPQDVIDWSYRRAMRRESGSAEKDGGVRAYYYDPDIAGRKPVTVGDEPFEDIDHLHESEDQARKAARAKFSENERGKETLTLTIPGQPNLVAEAPLVLDGWRPQLPTDWRITRCAHTISGDEEYSTQIEAQRMR